MILLIPLKKETFGLWVWNGPGVVKGLCFIALLFLLHMMLLLKWSEALQGGGQMHLLEEIQAISISSGLEKNNSLSTVDLCVRFCLYLNGTFLT